MKISRAVRVRQPASCSRSSSSRPRPTRAQQALERTIRELAELQPAFVSVTYGAGGSTRTKTIELVQWIEREARLTAMAHLTCVGASQEEIGGVVDRLVEGGIDNIMVLRGDPPAGQATFERTRGRLRLRLRPGRLHPQALRQQALPGRRRQSRRARGVPRPGSGHHAAQGQGGRGPGLRRHPAVLRQPRLLRLRQARPRRRHHRPDRPGADADHGPSPASSA